MENIFLCKEHAEELHKLGFNQPCLASWNYHIRDFCYNGQPSDFRSDDVIQIPTYEQAFDFFRTRYGLYGYVVFNTSLDCEYQIRFIYRLLFKICTSPEDARYKCIEKLIELANKNHANTKE